MKTPSIVSVPTERRTLRAFEVRAKISKPDIEAMATEMKGVFATEGTVDILKIISNWDGIDTGAV